MKKKTTLFVPLNTNMTFDISLSEGLAAGNKFSIVKTQLNHNSTEPNITLSWVRHENDFAYHPTPHPTQTQCQQ